MKTFTSALILTAVLALVGCAGSDEDTAQKEQTARKAYDAFVAGWATGDFEPYIAMLSEQFEFSYPAGADRGLYTGAEGRTRMVNKVRGHSSRGERLTIKPPTRHGVAGNTVFFEFDSEGQFGDYPYRGHNIIAFDVQGDRITAFREFFGDIDPPLFCPPPQP